MNPLIFPTEKEFVFKKFESSGVKFSLMFALKSTISLSSIWTSREDFFGFNFATPPRFLLLGVMADRPPFSWTHRILTPLLLIFWKKGLKEHESKLHTLDLQSLMWHYFLSKDHNLYQSGLGTHTNKKIFSNRSYLNETHPSSSCSIAKTRPQQRGKATFSLTRTLIKLPPSTSELSVH